MRPARIFKPAALTAGMLTLTGCGLFGSGAEPVSTATPSATDETSVARVLRVIDAEMARAGFGVAAPEGGSTLYDTISAAQDQADQQAGIYSRTIDCTLPSRLNSTLTSVNNAQGIYLKEPLETADSLTRRLEEYETASDLPLLSTVAQTQSVKTLRDALVRARDSKRIVYNLAEEAERERLERKKAEKDARGEPRPKLASRQLPNPPQPTQTRPTRAIHPTPKTRKALLQPPKSTHQTKHKDAAPRSPAYRHGGEGRRPLRVHPLSRNPGVPE